jgi:hypothetical protein
MTSTANLLNLLSTESVRISKIYLVVNNPVTVGSKVRESCPVFSIDNED